jgi:hypothetical protein
MTWGRKTGGRKLRRTGSAYALNASSEQTVEKVFTALADLRAEDCL